MATCVEMCLKTGAPKKKCEKICATSSPPPPPPPPSLVSVLAWNDACGGGSPYCVDETKAPQIIGRCGTYGASCAAGTVNRYSADDRSCAQGEQDYAAVLLQSLLPSCDG